MKSRTLHLINHLFLFLFFGHGILYYFSPENILNPDSPLKWIKYICVVALFLFNIKRINVKDLSAFLLFTLFIFSFIAISHDLEGETMTYLLRCINYIFPFSVILFRNILPEINFRRVFLYVTIIAVFAAFLDFYIIRGVFSYLNFLESEGFLRTASIFVTPNNAGFCFFLLYVFFIENLDQVNSIKKLVPKLTLLALILWSILLTGSKTGLLLILLYHFFKMAVRIFWIETITIKKVYLRFIALVAFLGLLLSPAVLLSNNYISNWVTGSFENFRGFSTETGSIRYEQALDFLEHASGSFISPDCDQLENTYDNALIQLWGDLNLIGALIFLACLFALIYSSLKRINLSAACLVGIFLLSSFSLNIFYLWPLTYIFWYLLFIFDKTNGKTAKL